MHLEKLTDRNFQLYAAKNYSNPCAVDMDEFYEDLLTFKYIKRLINKYRDSGELRERLILNHIIVVYNLFGLEAGTRMLFLKLKNQEKELATFLSYLSVLPKVVINIDGKNIVTSTICQDLIIKKALESI